MGFLQLARAAWRVPGPLVRAAEDLHAVAERARRDPDPVDEARELIAALLVEIHALNARAEAVNDTGREIVSGGEELTENAAVIAVHLTVFREALPRLLN